jgi:hypothetical protein
MSSEAGKPVISPRSPTSATTARCLQHGRRGRCLEALERAERAGLCEVVAPERHLFAAGHADTAP